MLIFEKKDNRPAERGLPLLVFVKGLIINGEDKEAEYESLCASCNRF